ncbi:hypothetical protein U1Q18_018964 [Sarracenia purpurea var. burkii]
MFGVATSGIEGKGFWLNPAERIPTSSVEIWRLQRRIGSESTARVKLLKQALGILVIGGSVLGNLRKIRTVKKAHLEELQR